MPKKYLLYIHDGRFEKEKKKSDLVNRLLDEYYLKPQVEALQLISPQKARVYKDLEVASFKLCKHNAHPDFCKHAKPGQPCK